MKSINLYHPSCRKWVRLSCVSIFFAAFCACGPSNKHVVADVVDYRAYTFPLEDVRLLDSPFKHAQDIEAQYLLEIEPDRLLHRFRSYAGLEPKGDVYDGWESESLSGHTLGHYMTACVRMYQATGNPEFKERVFYIVDELAICQKAHGNGYVGGIPNQDNFWKEVAAGDIHSAGFDLNGAWAPWYTLHKMMAGLIDAYLYLDDSKALTVLTNFCDWVCNTFNNLTEEQFQQMLDCEFGGMNEMMAEAYALTGNKAYFDMAYRFNHKKILDPLSESKDILTGKHSNTQIPKIIGCTREYELNLDKKQYQTAVFFWNRMVYHHSYVTGGNSNGEYLGEPDKLNDRLSPNTTETCNTYNMLKLTRRLFCWEPRVEYGDYYEKALYNHILASQNPDDGMCCYFVPLKSGTEKNYNDKFHSFTCCSGTGMENHGKYGEAIYFGSKDDGLFINLFIPSQLKWKKKGMTIRLETDYPASGSIRISFDGKKNNFPIYVRYPSWAYCTERENLQISGTADITGHESFGAGNWVKINGTWEKGKYIDLEIPFGLRLESMPDNPARAAILYGPIVLAGELGEEEPDPILGIPVLLTDNRPVKEWVKPVQDKPLHFTTVQVGQPNDVSLIPFYALHHQKHIVYFDFFTQENWKEKQQVFEKEKKRQYELERRTIDWCQPGEMQPERDHNQQGERSSAGDFGGKKYRDANNGGWFSYDMRVDAKLPMILQCTWWGNDGGQREFDIFIDNKKIASEKLNRNRPNLFYTQDYSIPTDLTQGKEKVTIKFIAKPNNIAGGLFGLRMVKK